MRGLIQRVRHAQVDVAGETIGAIQQGILLLLGVEDADDDARCDRLVQRVVNYRIFPDSEGRMNQSVLQQKGGILVVSQFTLVADTTKGNRPGFSTAASPEMAERLYKRFVNGVAKLSLGAVETGRFGADMQVSLVNDGPVTFLLET